MSPLMCVGFLKWSFGYRKKSRDSGRIQQQNQKTALTIDVWDFCSQTGNNLVVDVTSSVWPMGRRNHHQTPAVKYTQVYSWIKKNMFKEGFFTLNLSFFKFAAGRLVNVNIESHLPLMKCPLIQITWPYWGTLFGISADQLLIQYTYKGNHFLSALENISHHPTTITHFNHSVWTNQTHPAQQEITKRHHSSMDYFSDCFLYVFTWGTQWFSSSILKARSV